MTCEIELKYFIFHDKLKKHLNLNSLSKKKITQYYFKKKKIRELLFPILKEEMTPLSEKDKDKICRGRIRKIEESAKTTYYLTIKSKKRRNLSRIEIEKEISKEDYDSLKLLSNKGNLKKVRHELPGEIKIKDKVIPILAEIDYLTSANDQDIPHIDKNRFYTIDVEVEQLDYVEPVRAGKHSFDFLSDAIEFSKLDKDLVRSLKGKSLVRNGFPEEVHNYLNSK